MRPFAVQFIIWELTDRNYVKVNKLKSEVFGKRGYREVGPTYLGRFMGIGVWQCLWGVLRVRQTLLIGLVLLRSLYGLIHLEMKKYLMMYD
jgi:hypothetical protein